MYPKTTGNKEQQEMWEYFFNEVNKCWQFNQEEDILGIAVVSPGMDHTPSELHESIIRELEKEPYNWESALMDYAAVDRRHSGEPEIYYGTYFIVLEPWYSDCIIRTYWVASEAKPVLVNEKEFKNVWRK